MQEETLEQIRKQVERNKRLPNHERATSATPPLTIVVYDWESMMSQGLVQAARIPASFMQNMLFIGMITNMPGYCLVIDRDGKGHWGQHPEMFFVLTEEET